VAGFQARMDKLLEFYWPVTWEGDALSVPKTPRFYGREAKSAKRTPHLRCYRDTPR